MGNMSRGLKLGTHKLKRARAVPAADLLRTIIYAEQSQEPASKPYLLFLAVLIPLPKRRGEHMLLYPIG